MKELVEFIAASLVDDPREVRVREVQVGKETRIEVRVAGGDLGRIIGRQGRTARALRALLAAAGRKTRKVYNLQIVE